MTQTLTTRNLLESRLRAGGRSRTSSAAKAKSANSLKKVSKGGRKSSKSRSRKRSKKPKNNGLFACCAKKKKKASKRGRKGSKSRGKKSHKGVKSKSRRGGSKSSTKSTKSLRNQATNSQRAPRSQKSKRETQQLLPKVTLPSEPQPTAKISPSVPRAQTPIRPIAEKISPKKEKSLIAPQPPKELDTHTPPHAQKLQKDDNNPPSDKSETKVAKKEKKPKDFDTHGSIELDEKEIQYPAQKFTISQYVENNTRVRRWVYEDVTPLTMHSNMKHMLELANSKILACRSEKEKRDDLMRGLDQLSSICEERF
ncbi:unnamed protein product [Caenorhabditis bovis]|uniref:Uncharacterized protein n=1 Tax=Caenorhabditis bovis TaxID=2654633 RepID=A0A8S1EHF4_9PELO|nr:unnamed protein product [Caenorhabditis bovis]